MAQSRIQPLDLGELMKAYKDTGTADAINAGSEGLKTGVTLAQSLAMKRLEQQKLIQDAQDKKAKLALDIANFKREQEKDQANRVPLPPTPLTASPKGLPANAPTAAYDPDSDTVTPNMVQKSVTPEAFNAMNPGADKLFAKELAQKVKNGEMTAEEAATKLEQTKTPETFTTLAENTKKPQVLVKGSKSNDTKVIDMPADFRSIQGLSGEARNRANDIRESQFTEKQWNELEKRVNTLSAGSRSALGTAAGGNLKAERAKDVLSDPNANGQDFAAAIADLASIYQGGSPTIEGLKSQEYNTLKGYVNQLKTFATSSPQVLETPEVKKHLIDTINHLQGVNNRIVEQNTRTVKAGFEGTINQDPERWDRLVSAAHQEIPDPKAVHNAALDWANQQLATNPNDPKALAVKQKAMKEMGQ